MASVTRGKGEAMSLIPRHLKEIIAYIYLLPFLFVLCIPLISSFNDEVSISSMLTDPAATVVQSRLTGLVSNIGVLIWTATVTLLLFMSVVRFHMQRADKIFWFLLYFGGFSLVLMLDDFFLLHEGFSNLFLISENFVFLSYSLTLIAGLVWFKDVIKSTDYELLFLALILLAAAILIGFIRYQIQFYIGEGRVLIEAGLKFLGIVGWFGYFARVVYVLVMGPLGSHKQS